MLRGLGLYARAVGLGQRGFWWPVQTASRRRAHRAGRPAPMELKRLDGTDQQIGAVDYRHRRRATARTVTAIRRATMVVGLPRAGVPGRVMFLERHALRCKPRLLAGCMRCLVVWVVAIHLTTAIRRTRSLDQHQQRPPADAGRRDQQRQGHQDPRQAPVTGIESTHRRHERGHCSTGEDPRNAPQRPHELEEPALKQLHKTVLFRHSRSRVCCGGANRRRQGSSVTWAAIDRRHSATRCARTPGSARVGL